MTRSGSKFHDDRSSQRMKRDETDVNKFEKQIQRFNPFNRQGDELVCISANNVARDDITQDLLTSPKRGTELLNVFVENRLLPVTKYRTNKKETRNEITSTEMGNTVRSNDKGSTDRVSTASTFAGGEVTCECGEASSAGSVATSLGGEETGAGGKETGAGGEETGAGGEETGADGEENGTGGEETCAGGEESFRGSGSLGSPTPGILPMRAQANLVGALTTLDQPMK
ncbi:uncharacterized protein LOC121877278 [Homarus americanus]|uniref:uncharacterized protein LOC121877278 n=1 Tax=Homarus americanus TaxID=6706 RepID=UPI001C438876|nr:uncharacterized protein LOC121877278 [Homarus americanus]